MGFKFKKPKLKLGKKFGKNSKASKKTKTFFNKKLPKITKKGVRGGLKAGKSVVKFGEKTLDKVADMAKSPLMLMAALGLGAILFIKLV